MEALDETWDWLDQGEHAVLVALASHAALRLFPLATLFAELTPDTAHYTLAAARAILAAQAWASDPREDLADAARRAAEASPRIRKMHAHMARRHPEAAGALEAAALAADAAAAADPQDAVAATLRAWEGVRVPMPDLQRDTWDRTPVPISDREAQRLEDWRGVMDCEFDRGPHWDFWRDWFEGAMAGRPVAWRVQRRIALIGDADWNAGPEVIAQRIEEIVARETLRQEIQALEARMSEAVQDDPAEPEDGEDEVESEVESEVEAGSPPAASFGAIRLIQAPLAVLIRQTESAKPQPFLIMKSVKVLRLIVMACGKWLGKPADAEAKDMVRAIGRAGGVSTARWIMSQAPQLRAVIRAAEAWTRTIPH